jgi:hypothetical protein
VKAALSEIIYVHRALNAEWEELNEAGKIGPMEYIRHISKDITSRVLMSIKI